jgi:TonB family protein
MVLRFVCLVVVAWLFAPSGLRAQEGSELVPPSVAQPAEAVYPPDALANGQGASVELLVTIAVDGTVMAAEIVESAGPAFDEAAREALLRFRFEPARQDGQPVPSRIRYRYAFTPPAPPAPPPAATPLPPPSGSLRGKLSAADGAPVADAEVRVVDASGQTRSLRSDVAGAFALTGLPPGPYQLLVDSPAYLGAAFEETVVAGEETQVAYRLVARSEDEDDPYSARASVEAPTREVTRRTLDRQTMLRIPGTGNDPIRAVEVLPGVARPPFGSGQLIIRGSSPRDSWVFVDGMPIPQLYHFGGLRSVYNAQLLRQISLFPGNFSSRYGRATGGVFELETRDAASDGLHGVVDVSLLDGSIMLEGPLTKRFSLAGSIRRSLFDLLLRALAQGSDVGFTALPTYYDYQLSGTYRTKRDYLRLQFYGSSDHVGLLAADEREANASRAANAIEATQRFNFLQLSWKHKLTERTDQTIGLQTGPTLVDVSAGTDLRLRLKVWQTYGRAEWFTRAGDHVRVITGIDVFTGAYRATYSGPSFGQGEGNPYEDSGGEDELGARADGFLFQPGVYTDVGFDAGILTLNAALRADYYHEIEDYSLDPRLVAELRVHPQWTLKLGAGLYSQPPQAEESHPAVGNPELEPIRTAQFAGGVSHQPLEGVKLGLEGFYKLILNNVVGALEPDEPIFNNDGVGRVYGMEASAQVQPVRARYAGIASYTLLNSERKDHPETVWRKFDYHQTHGLSVAFLYLFNRGWDVGLAYRHFTGNPYTPVTGRVLDTTDRSYRPIYGAVNSARNPAFNRLDFRVQKTWKAQKYTATLYLDVQNALNTRNQEAFFYNFDFTEEEVVSGLPIIPALGMRGQF